MLLLLLSLFFFFFSCKACSVPLGMESRRIKDAQITASSHWTEYHAAFQGRLNFNGGGGKAGGWSAGYTDANPWIQVDLSSFTKLTGIATQGRNSQDGYSQWVTKYTLEYSDDGVNFRYYKEPGQGLPKVNRFQKALQCDAPYRGHPTNFFTS